VAGDGDEREVDDGDGGLGAKEAFGFRVHRGWSREVCIGHA
jgi:hypothetical protein